MENFMKCDQICENRPRMDTMIKHSFHYQSIALSICQQNTTIVPLPQVNIILLGLLSEACQMYTSAQMAVVALNKQALGYRSPND